MTPVYGAALARAAAAADAPLKVAHVELLRAVVERRLGQFRGASLEIECYRLEATRFRELVDLLLSLHGNRERVWVDESGRRLPGARPGAAARRLLRELCWAAPRVLLQHQRRVRALARQPARRGAAAVPTAAMSTAAVPTAAVPTAAASTAAAPAADAPAANRAPAALPPAFERALFLRTDHDFGLAAGGSVGHIAGVIDGFRRAGIALDVVATDRLRGVPEDARFHHAPPVYEPIRNLPELALLAGNDQLLEFVEARWARLRPDFVYQRYSLNNYVGAVLRARHGVPFVCEYNGPLVWVHRHWEDRPLFFERLADRIERLNLAAADLVVVVSRAVAEHVTARGIPADKVLVNPNGVDPTRYSPEVSGAEVRRRHGLDGKIVVGFIGTFGPWHGAEELVRAAAHLLAADTELRDRLHFLLIGDGARMDAVRRLVHEHALAGRVTLTGLVPQEQGPAHLAAADILVSPHVPNPDGSPFFGSPTKVFEYMAMGRAIVASALGQIADVLAHGVTAWLVPPADPPALADGIRRLAQDPQLRGRLADAARREVVRQHSWAAHTRRTLDALRHLAPQPPAGRS